MASDEVFIKWNEYIKQHLINTRTTNKKELHLKLRNGNQQQYCWKRGLRGPYSVVVTFPGYLCIIIIIIIIIIMSLNVRKHSDMCDQRRLISLRIRAVWSVFVVRMKKLCILGYTKCTKSRFWADFANVQAGLNLCWANTSKGTFSKVVTLTFITGPTGYVGNGGIKKTTIGSLSDYAVIQEKTGS